jgi:2-polyprenyl-3-methyl-5-hydroxy-6-metoxy-1,4-benzoquinol methylase
VKTGMLESRRCVRMTPQHAITTRISRSPLKLAGFLLRLGWAFIVLAAVCLAWLALFLLFAPFIVLSQVLGLRNRIAPQVGTSSSATDTACFRTDDVRLSATQTSDVPLIFDRRHDVSKLFGCNTRGVRYRWTLFADRLETLRREFSNPVALDFGAGSLRDSYELVQQGFSVISFDLNETVMRRYFDSYNWSEVRSTPKLVAGDLGDLQEQEHPINLAIAFDVIEHLPDPASYVRALNQLLGEGGLLFTIVPNRRSLFERYFKRSLRKAMEKGVTLEPGVPHMQFKSPEEWDSFFQENGFSILEHDMTIGHFVNDWWNGLLCLPLRAFVSPVLQVIAFRGGFDFDPDRWEQRFCPEWLMEEVNLADVLLKDRLSRLFGWNLIVARKQSIGSMDDCGSTGA